MKYAGRDHCHKMEVRPKFIRKKTFRCPPRSFGFVSPADPVTVPKAKKSGTRSPPAVDRQPSCPHTIPQIVLGPVIPFNRL